MSNVSQFVVQVSIWALPTIFAIVLHEVMHGVVANALGDDTAARAGRLTLNPISHIDPFGTLFLPAMLLFLHLPVFGFAKPVPVDFRRLRNPRRGMILVAAAGPLTNLTLAIASAWAMRLLIGNLETPWGPSIALPLVYMARASVFINVVLGVFNLFPLLPLDGGRVAVGLMPLDMARNFARLEPYGFPILLLLLYMGWISSVIDPIIDTVTRVLL